MKKKNITFTLLISFTTAAFLTLFDWLANHYLGALLDVPTIILSDSQIFFVAYFYTRMISYFNGFIFDLIQDKLGQNIKNLLDIVSCLC